LRLPRGSRRQAVQRLFDMCWRHFLTEIGAPEHSDTLALYPGFWTPPNPLAPLSCTLDSGPWILDPPLGPSSDGNDDHSCN
jgi:hypothetical protein